MILLGAEIDGPLVLTRATHFAASAITAGAVMFRVLIAEPALRRSPAHYAAVRARITALTWTGLAIAVATGLVWFVLQTISMTGLAGGEAIRSGAMLTVVDKTQFGLVSEVRAALALLLAACLVLSRFVLSRWFALATSLGLVGAIAWTGHAGSTLGELGNLHLTADVLHLFAASAWIGGLIGLAILFAAGRRRPTTEWAPLQLGAVRRFSVLGIVSVAVLILSGVVNSWFLVGSIRALLITDYGHVLLLKLGAFAVMLGFAGANRFLLTPRLTLGGKPGGYASALSALMRNTFIEIALGLAIFALVGVLGTLHPAIHLVE